MPKKVFLFILICLFFGTIYAQKITQFSSDTTKFTKDLNIYFAENSANRDQAAEYIRNFEKLWKDGIISGYFKETIIETANTMLKRRMKPYPYFYGYLNTVINAIQSQQLGGAFENWQKCLTRILLGKSNRGVQEFFEMSENIFKNRTFYKTPSYAYYSLQDNFSFEYDSIPLVRFENITMVGANPRGDSIAIEETSGIYYPTSGKFKGKGGMVSWESAGLDNSNYANLNRYEIDCKTGSYNSDSATFNGKQFFDKPQLGRLTDRIITENKEKSYPQFFSYSKRLLVHDIYPDVDFDGGFGMRGAKFIGSGSPNNPARIIFKKDDIKFLEVSARAFGMSKDKIVASPGIIKFFLEKDTIYHPGVSFTYQVDKRLVTIVRGDDGLQKTPFLNTFHKYDMYFEQIIWPIDEPKMYFNFLPNNFQGEAYFESMDFYSRDKADAISIGEQISPINRLVEFYNHNKKQASFSVVDFAKYIKYLATDLRPIIFKMAISGLIYYNPETDIITVRQRLFDYLDNAKHKHDYDIITLHSIYPGKDNGEMNLLNYDITVRGVKQVLLSDTQKVFMFPKFGEVVLKKNRRMDFSGSVASGKFEFIGVDFIFDYEQFKINLKTIDSIKIYVESFEPDVNGNIPFRKVQTLIENTSGELKIDAPKNKSGWGRASTFPSFQSFKESYAFYDKRKIFKGVYNRDKFYFKLDPFNIDSLDNFRNASLKFNGTFASAGIFPDFKDVLSLQKDYSLGFIRQTPPGGFNIYGGKGIFDQEIRLSNKGLRGSGDLNFSSSKSKVSDLIFFPDSANGIANTFDVTEGSSPEFPSAHGDTVRLHFLPYDDLLQAYNQKTPFRTYREKISFKGRYDLSFKELIGDGMVDFEKADLSSNKILFNRRKFFSDTANFHLKAFDEEGFTFSTVNVNAKIDLDARFGEFSTNGEGSYVKFDKCQYIAYMDRFKWFMDAEDIELGDTQKKIDVEAAESGIDLDGPKFISIHPKQDSLRFFSPGAKYNLRKYIIFCKNVPFIDVADARVTPDKGDVTIFKNAVMDTLRKSEILANTVTKFHTIRNTTTNIFGRRNYLASGEYQYIDENEKPYLINFQTIRPDTAGQTISEGDIPESDHFKFNDYFSFAGKVKLFASEQFLTFDGGTKIEHSCSRVGKSYLKFTGEINPREILIPIPKNAKDMRGAAIGTGLFYNSDSNAVFTSFMSLEGTRISKPVIEADGLLTFDKENQRYEISNKEKLEEKSLSGNYVSLSTDNCKIETEGRYDISHDLGQIKLNCVGNANYNTINDSLSFNLMMVFDFYFESSIIKKMAKDFEVYLTSLNPVTFDGDLINHGLIELLGKERGDRALSDLNLYGNYKKFPDEIEKNLVLSEVKLKYNKKAKAYISEGALGVGNILKTEIFRYMDGIIQIKKQKGGDLLDIYLSPDANTWYYFTFSRGTMLAISSNNEFNKAIETLKGKNKKLNSDKGPSYRFDIAKRNKRDLFLDKMKQIGAFGDKETEEEEPKKEEN
jgi:hypothetical protein